MEKRVFIDDRLESYQTFFDHDWARRMDAVASGTAVERFAFDLSLACKQAANTHVMPWLLVRFLAGSVETSEPFGAKWISAVRDRLLAELGPDVRNMLRRRLKEALDRIHSEVTCALDESRHLFRFDVDNAWRELLALSEFQLSVSGSQRLCYGAVYFAYEDFLVQCYRTVSGNCDYKMRSAKQFACDFEQVFGPELTDSCCSDQRVNLARLTRNALVHNGGRLTDELKRQPTPPFVENGEIQITPSETAGLFNILKTRALELATRSVEILHARDNGGQSSNAKSQEERN